MQLLNEKQEEVLKAIIKNGKYDRGEMFSNNLPDLQPLPGKSKDEFSVCVRRLIDLGYLEKYGIINPHPFSVIVTSKGLSYFDDKDAYEKRQPTNVAQQVFNIGSAENSIIGSQQTATINVVLTIEEFNKKIDTAEEADKPELRALSDTLSKYGDGSETPAKGALSRFGDLITKYRWIPETVAQVLIAWLTNR